MSRSRVFRTLDHRIWFLSRIHVDVNGGQWLWDGNDYDEVAGPEMVQPSMPLLHLPLIGLALHSGLHSDTAAAERAGELVLQQHDAAEAGYAAVAAFPYPTTPKEALS